MKSQNRLAPPRLLCFLSCGKDHTDSTKRTDENNRPKTIFVIPLLGFLPKDVAPVVVVQVRFLRLKTIAFFYMKPKYDDHLQGQITAAGLQ